MSGSQLQTLATRLKLAWEDFHVLDEFLGARRRNSSENSLERF